MQRAYLPWTYWAISGLLIVGTWPILEIPCKIFQDLTIVRWARSPDLEESGSSASWILLKAMTKMVVKGWMTWAILGKNPHTHKYKMGTPTAPSKKLQPPPPPLKRGILWAWGFSIRKKQKIPGAQKIGAAISGPRIAGGKTTDMRLFLNFFPKACPPWDLLSLPPEASWPQRPWWPGRCSAAAGSLAEA